MADGGALHSSSAMKRYQRGGRTWYAHWLSLCPGDGVRWWLRRRGTADLDVMTNKNCGDIWGGALTITIYRYVPD